MMMVMLVWVIAGDVTAAHFPQVFKKLAPLFLFWCGHGNYRRFNNILH
jgi:hypothetical protein